MVLAVAVLLLQVRVVQAEAPAPSADATTVSVTKDATASRQPNLDNIKLGEAPSFSEKPSSAPAAPLKTVAYNTSSQNSQSLSTIRVPESKNSKDDIKYAETYSSRRWLALSAVQSAASGFDAYSTRYAVGHGAIEEDPLMRPFAHSPSIYAVSQLCPVALDFLARRMQRSPNVFLRRMWWLPQTTSTGVYILSGVHNLHVASQISH